MKFWIPLLAGAATVQANQQSLDVILAAFSSISNWTATLTTAINGFEGIAQATDLLAANMGTLAAIQGGVKNVTAVSPIAPLDALQLTAPTIQLVNAVNSSIETIISKRTTFVNASLGGIVYDSLTQLRCASEQFSNATISRLPGGGITIASRQLAAPIPLSFEKGLIAYKASSSNMTTNCTPVSDVNPNPVDTTINGASLLSTNAFSAIILAVVTAAFML